MFKTGKTFTLIAILFLNVILACSTCFADTTQPPAITFENGWLEHDSDNDLLLDKPSPVVSLWNDIWTLPPNIPDDMKGAYLQKNNFTALLIAGAASVVMHNEGIDDDIADNFDDNQALNDKWFDEGVALAGSPGIHFAATGIWYLASDHTGDELSKQRALTMFRALSITGLSTLSLKLIRGSETPNGKWDGWPSGHTASSFTVAAVLDEFYGPKVGIPAYIGAGFVGYRMMDSGDHWASDVLFGAVMGYIVGHYVAGDNKDIKLAGFELVPYMDHQYGQRITGINLYKRF